MAPATSSPAAKGKAVATKTVDNEDYPAYSLATLTCNTIVLACDLRVDKLTVLTDRQPTAFGPIGTPLPLVILSMWTEQAPQEAMNLLSSGGSPVFGALNSA